MNSTSPSGQVPISAGAADGPGRERPEKDNWDKLGVIGRLAASVVMAIATLVVGTVGYRVNKSMNDANTILKEAELQSHQVEFVSNYDLAVTQMRGQALAALWQYLAPELSDDNKRVALLAGLHSTYSEFFDTRPVLEAFSQDIKDEGAKRELRRLAKRVAQRQAESLRMQGGVTIEMEFALLTTNGGKANQMFELDEHQLDVTISNLEYKDDVTDSLEVELRLRDEKGLEEVAVSFSLSYMDSPFLDNVTVRHENGQIDHFAVMLLSISKNGEDYDVVLKFLHFPTDVLTPFDVRREMLQNLAKPAAETHSH